MNIEDLQAYKPATITLTVKKLEDIREFEKFGKVGKVRNAIAADSKGKQISITLWNDEIDLLKEGDEVTIEKGWVSEFQGNLQISSGKFGKLIVNKSDGQDSVTEEVI